MSTPMIESAPCVVCGCHLVKTFMCGCGSCKNELYCVNCGRFRTLSPAADTTLAPFDARCEAGAVEHDHSEDEKCARIAAYFQSLSESN